MRFFPLVILLGAIVSATTSIEKSVAAECPGLRLETKSTWEAALKQHDEAQAAFVRGDATAIKQMWSRTDDVTLFGAGAGGDVSWQRGWAQVGPRLDWAASQFSPPISDATQWERESITVNVCEGLASTVHIERFRARRGSAKEERRLEVRVTLIWRQEPLGWRIVHRHGDPLTPR